MEIENRAVQYALNLASDRRAYVFAFTCALDNHEPSPRAVAYGHGVSYLWADRQTPGFTVWADEFAALGKRAFERLTRAVFVVDDGKTVTPYYCAGWKDSDGVVMFEPFPTNPDGRKRDDNGRTIDYASWMLGPRTMLHMKTHAADAPAVRDMDTALALSDIPEDFPVRPITPDAFATDRVTCGTCGLSWDDAISTEWTPAPSARCPFEYFHVSAD